MNRKPIAKRRQGLSSKFVRVTERVYVAIGYARANVLFIVTDKSAIVIDTTESPAGARACLAEFRKVCTLPVSYIVYTHFHGDHIRGAKVFHQAGSKVIAHRRMPAELAKVQLLLPYHARATELQFGLRLSAKNREVPVVSPEANKMPRAMFMLPLRENGYVPPDITFDEEYCFEEGAVRVELHHMPGETVDQLIVWLPQEKALCPADLFYPSFPMLSSPMKADRPVLQWAESLERLRSLRANFLIPSHGQPMTAASAIDLALANYARAIRFVHDETVKRINQGLPLERIRHQVRLPEELSRLPYLQERYGTVAWAINGIFRQYTGWYTFNPKDLNPCPKIVLHRALLEACGGARTLIRRARQALSEGQNQLALELVDIVLSANPRNGSALGISLAALRRLGAAARNGLEHNIYFAGSQRAPRRKQGQ